QEALASARDLAVSRGNAEVQPEHLLLALIGQEGGLVPRVLAKLGADPRVVQADLEKSVDKLPKVRGAGLEVGISRRLKEVWDAAAKEADKLKDEFLSTEHFLLALASPDAGKSDVAAALRNAGATYDAILEALVSVRGNQRVTDQDPEGKYE